MASSRERRFGDPAVVPASEESRAVHGLPSTLLEHHKEINDAGVLGGIHFRTAPCARARASVRDVERRGVLQVTVS